MNFIDLKSQYERIREPMNARIQKVLDHGQYILGPETVELENDSPSSWAQSTALPHRAARTRC